jgi:unsaturated pyranuronate lyase
VVNDSIVFFDVSSIPFERKRDRVLIKSITGENVQLSFVRLEPGERTDHVHDHEQIGYVLSGHVEITIGEETRVVGPGEAYRIPSQVRHGFNVKDEDGVEYLEVFSPPKAENRTG